MGTVRLALVSTTSLVALLLPSPAWSQEQQAATREAATTGVQPVSGDGLEEIIVTAERRAENVQDVPIAISAFTADELETRNITQTLDLVQYVPNLFGSNNAGIGSANTYYLRGLGNTESIATFDPPVGTYIDDIYLSRQNANNFGFFDVERIEVLRGPQGIFFGRNTTGGAVNVILKKPGRELGGFAEVGYGRFDRKLARGSVDLPLSDSFAVKLSGYWQNDDGFVKNTTTGERLNDNDGMGARAAIRADFSNAVTWNASAALIQSNAENSLNFECNPLAPSECRGRFASTGFREQPLGGQNQLSPLVLAGRKQNYNFGNRTDSLLLTSNLQIDGGAFTINFVTGYVDVTQQYALDLFDGRPAPSLLAPNPIPRQFARGGFTLVNDGSHKQFTNELKVYGSLLNDRIDYVAGIYLYDEDNSTDFADLLTSAATGLPVLLADRLLKNDTNAKAVYAQLDFHPTDQFTLTAGARYTHETKSVAIFDQRASCAAGPSCLFNSNFVAPNGAPIPSELSTKIWTPRFAAKYEPTDDLLIFASATRGFKSGGWAARATAPSQFLPFEPETVWSYETGFKSELFDNRLRVNVTAFWMDVTDLQTPSALLNPNGSINYITQNFADYRNKGVEFEITARPTERLNLYFTGGYQDDNYRLTNNPNIYGIRSVGEQLQLCRQQLAAGQIPLGPNTAPAGATPNNAPACAAGIVTANGEVAEPVRTPKWTFSAGVAYDFPVASTGWMISPALNVVYRGRSQVQTANNSLYLGSTTGVNGTFPSNPFGGEFITGSESPGHALVNASIAIQTDDTRWSFTAECNNCFNKTVNETAISNFMYLNAPGSWMLRAKRAF